MPGAGKCSSYKLLVGGDLCIWGGLSYALWPPLRCLATCCLATRRATRCLAVRCLATRCLAMLGRG